MTDELRLDDDEPDFTALVDARVLRNPSMPAGPKLLFINLRVYIGNNSVAWPGERKLARDLGQGERTIRRWIALLQEHGWLSVEERPGKTHLYTAHMKPAREPKSGPTVQGDTDAPDPGQNGRTTPAKMAGHPGQNGRTTPAKMAGHPGQNGRLKESRNIVIENDDDDAGACDDLTHRSEEADAAAELGIPLVGAQLKRLRAAAVLARTDQGVDPVEVAREVRRWLEETGTEPRNIVRLYQRFAQTMGEKQRRGKIIPIQRTDRDEALSHPAPNRQGSDVWTEVMDTLWDWNRNERLGRQLTCPQLFQARFVSDDGTTLTFAHPDFVGGEMAGLVQMGAEYLGHERQIVQVAPEENVS